MKTALYARVSTLDKGQDAGMQLREMREHCQRKGWTITAEYVDNGVSGAKESRPELNRMMADAKAHAFESILVWRFDRFGRSLKHLVVALAEFESLGIAFVSLMDSIDLSTPQGKLMFGIVASMAEFERSLIQQRVRSGMANAAARGTKIGRPRVEVDAAKIIALRASGASWRTIQQETGVPKSTAQRVALPVAVPKPLPIAV